MTMTDESPQSEDAIYMDEDPATPEGLRAAASRNPRILTLPVELTVSIGGARLTIDELLAINEDTVITLDAKIDDPVTLMIGERVVARGALMESESDPSGLGVRITEVLRDSK